MGNKEHRYAVTTEWTGNNGEGTTAYNTYERSHVIRVAGKPEIAASSDTPFRGDREKHNPEDMLLASLSSCHMLWYLHLCADAGVVVTRYTDRAQGVMHEVAGGGGHFAEVTLFPEVTVTHASMVGMANALHDKAHEKCFIANSVNFPVRHSPVSTVSE